jgi:hypothetical protein
MNVDSSSPCFGSVIQDRNVVDREAVLRLTEFDIVALGAHSFLSIVQHVSFARSYHRICSSVSPPTTCRILLLFISRRFLFLVDQG